MSNIVSHSEVPQPAGTEIATWYKQNTPNNSTVLHALAHMKSAVDNLNAEKRTLYDRLDKTTKAFKKFIDAVEKDFPGTCDELKKEMAINEAVMKTCD